MRSICISRDEAEWLVDLLESLPNSGTQDWKVTLSDNIRESFGMITREQELSAMNTKYGKIAYEAYCKARGFKSVRGEPLPQFKAQDPEIQQAWIVASQAVSDEIRNQTATG